jgi:PAS domain S-box-containing protein
MASDTDPETGHSDLSPRGEGGPVDGTSTEEVAARSAAKAPVAESARIIERLRAEIEDRRRREKSLRESEERFRQVVENIPEVTWIVAPDWGEVTYISPAYEKVWGRSCESLYRDPRSWMDAVVEEDRPALEEVIANHRPDDSLPVVFPEYRIRRPDGSIRWIAARGVPVKNEEGRVCRVAGVAEDITERKRAEEEHRQKARLNQIFLDSLPPVAMLLSAHTREIIASNKAGEQVGAVPGKTCYETWGQSDKPCPWCRAPLLWKTGEAQHLQPEGLGRVWDAHWVPVSDGVYLHYACDITDQKRIEQEREKLVLQLEAQNAELEQFSYTVSHDLRSPLITVSGFVNLLAKELDKGNLDQAQDYLGRISRAAEMMNGLLNDILELSRIGRIASPSEEVRLEALAGEVVDLMAGPIEERGVRVETFADLPVLFGERARLRAVLQNLVENSVKYMGDQADPHVEIGARRDAGRIVCFVRDNGMGIEPEHHSRVFGLFHKLDVNSEGSGMGLAIAKRIVEVHGGRIWLESEGAGQGATFCFTIPPKETAA